MGQEIECPPPYSLMVSGKLEARKWKKLKTEPPPQLFHLGNKKDRNIISLRQMRESL
jgi:hypothetical protein